MSTTKPKNKKAQPLSLSPDNITWLFIKAAQEQESRDGKYVSASKIADDILTAAREEEAKKKNKKEDK